MVFHTRNRALKSRFADGSSNIIIEGLQTKESKIDIILR
jgi:hypothetical protein